MQTSTQKILLVLKKIILWGLIASISSVIIFRFIPPPVTPLMLIRCVEQKMDGKPMRLKKDWEPLQHLSRHFPAAVIASEDQNFLNHHGFDMNAIRKAYENNSRKKTRIKGASTISQQVAKNLFLWPGRSWIRKGFEVYFTLLIEIFWSKKRIVEVYLNIIETGDGIYGAEAASREYFRKPGSQATAPQAAKIAALLPNPRKWHPDKPTSYLLARQAWILKNMKRLGPPSF